MQNSPSAHEGTELLVTATAPDIADNRSIIEPTTPGSPSSVSPAANTGSESTSSAAPPPAPIAVSKPVLAAVKMALGLLRPHEENTKIYGDKESIDDLCDSIRRNNTGILEPLLITKDGRIISGHRRYRAAQKLELADVPVRAFESEDEIEILNALLEHNRHRVKTKSQIAREVTLQMRIKKEGARLQKEGTAGHKVAILPPPKKGKTRDKVGKDHGISGKSVEAAEQVIESIDKLHAAGKHEDAAQLENALNKGFSTARNLAVEKGVIEAPKNPKKARAKNTGNSEPPPAISPHVPPSTQEKPSQASGEQAAIPHALPAPAATSETTNTGAIEDKPRGKTLDSDTALTYADHAITFLRECEMLTKEQQHSWGKLIDQLNTLRTNLGF